MTDAHVVTWRILDLLNREIIKRGGDPNSLKSEAAYQRQLDKDVRDLYAGKLTEREFADRQVDRIDGQFNRAWNEGMRENGLDPKRDMTDEWAAALDDRKVKELDYIEGFASEIAQAGKAGDPVDPFRSRVPMWANRYNEVAALSKITTRPEDRFIWNLGPTEKHCESNGSTYGCLNLSGVVATGKQWNDAGVRPQTTTTTCGGYQCQCSLDPTDEPLTEGGIPHV
jgi:hypothetical protein